MPPKRCGPISQDAAKRPQSQGLINRHLPNSVHVLDRQTSIYLVHSESEWEALYQKGRIVREVNVDLKLNH